MPADATVTLFVAPPLIVFVFQRASGESCVDVCPIESVLFQANAVPSGLEITEGLNPCVLEMIEIVVVAASAGSVIPSASVTAITGVPIDWEIHHAGAGVMETEGTPLPDRVLDAIRSTRVALKGPITTPVGTGFRSVNVALRTELDLFASVRPARTLPGIRTRHPSVDIVTVRENTEDVYRGVEFERGSVELAHLRERLRELARY